MMRLLPGLLAVTGLLAGCGGPSTPAATDAPAPSENAVTDYEIPMTKLPGFTVGDYTVEPMYEEELKDGHLNTKITGGDVAAVRVWVGPEDGAGVLIVKTEIENDYH